MFASPHDGFSAGVFGPVVAVVWRDALTEDAVTEVEKILDSVCARATEPIAFLTVAQFKAPVPSAEIRERVVACYHRQGDKLGCVAQVVEGDGFWACGARCFIAGIGLLSKRERPMSVFGRLDEAVAWIARTLPTRVDAVATSRDVARMRQHAV